MKNKVYIDENTIKINPEWKEWPGPGFRQYKKVSQDKYLDVTFEADKYPLSLEKEPNVYCEGFSESPNNLASRIEWRIKITGEIKYLENLGILLWLNPSHISCKGEGDLIDITSMHEPAKYLYKWDKNITIKCSNCASMFAFEYVEIEEAEDDYNTTYEKCPVCGNVLRLDYETVEEFFERIENKCPNGYRFGKDTNEAIGCEECLSWRGCLKFKQLRNE